MKKSTVTKKNSASTKKNSTSAKKNNAIAPKAEGVYEKTQQKRDNIVRTVRTSTNTESIDKAIKAFHAYLKERQKKYTLEREYILRTIYQLSTPIDIDTLHKMLLEDNHYVSLATVYNTVQVLQDARLVKKIDLLDGVMSFYEQTIGMEPHLYSICKRCGNITIINKPELLKELQKECPRAFKAEDFSLNVYGICHKCDMALKKAETKQVSKSSKTDKTSHTRKIGKSSKKDPE